MIAHVLTFVHNFAANVFWFLVVVGVLVFLHESGHFLTAKLFGMKVDVFSFGFGKRLFGRRRGDTDYRISAIPLGGYVKLAGGDEAGEGSDGSEGSEARDPAEPLPPDYFLARPRWQRFLVLVMGVTVNLVMAVVFFAGAFMLGVEMPESGVAVIRTVDAGSPAEKAGMRSGDRIVRFDHDAVTTWMDVEKALLVNGSREVDLEIVRGEEKIEARVKPVFTETGLPDIGVQGEEPAVVTAVEPGMPAAGAGLQVNDRILAINGQKVDFTQVSEVIGRLAGKEIGLDIGRGSETVAVRLTPIAAKRPDGQMAGRIGVGLSMPRQMVKLSLLPAFRKALETTVESGGVLLATVRNLVTLRQDIRALSGPIGIAQGSRSSARHGASFLVWIAMISLNLGVLNLLPIPMLDGGHIFILLTEGIMRRNLSLKVKEALHFAGFVFLLLLMVVVIYLDIRRNV